MTDRDKQLCDLVDVEMRATAEGLACSFAAVTALQTDAAKRFAERLTLGHPSDDGGYEWKPVIRALNAAVKLAQAIEALGPLATLPNGRPPKSAVETPSAADHPTTQERDE